MSPKDLLTTEEVDALLHEVDRGSLDPETDPQPDAALYNFSEQQYIVRSTLPTLEMIYDKFSRKLRATLSGVLRRPATVEFNGMESMRYSDYSPQIPSPCIMYLAQLSPLHGTGLFMLQPRLAYLLVDSYFGGHATDVRVDTRREITAAELRITEIIVEHAIRDLEQSWAPVYKIRFEPGGVETNPVFAGIASPPDRVIVARFLIGPGTAAGELDIVIPYSMIEPIKDLLDTGMLGGHSNVDRHWHANVIESLQSVELELRGTLVETKLPVRKVLSFKPGDVIPIDLPKQVPLYLEGALSFRGAYGVARGRNSVKITQVLHHGEPIEPGASDPGAECTVPPAAPAAQIAKPAQAETALKARPPRDASCGG